MAYIVYAEGYRLQIELGGKETDKKYKFRKRFVTEVADQDAKHLLEMTSHDIEWCPSVSRTKKPFVSLEDYCAEKHYDKDVYLKSWTLLQ